MKKITLSLVIALLLSLMFVPAAFGRRIGPTIYVGQNTIAGFMGVYPNADGSITIEYSFWQGWCMTESAVHVGRSLEDFPTNRPGFTIPGHFDFKVYGPDSPCIKWLSITLRPNKMDPQWEYGDHIYMAIHVVADNPMMGLYEETGWTVRCGVKEGHYFKNDMWAGGLWLEILEDDWD